MKLSQDSVKNLKTLLQAVSIAKIDKLVIEPTRIRGIDDSHTVLILSNNKIPDFGGASVGLNRLAALSNRINLFDSNEDFNVEAVEAPSRNNEDGTNIATLKISSKGFKFEHGCARIETVKAPRNINDRFVWKVKIDPELIKVVIKAADTMESEQIAICSKASGEVSLEVVDAATKDTFMTKIAESATWLIEDEEPQIQSFVHYVSVKALMPLLKASSTTGELILLIGQDGMVQINVHDHAFILLPREE